MLRSWLIVLLAVECNSNILPNYGFNGIQLKFVSGHIVPFDIITLGSDGNLTHSGSNPLLYNWLGKKLNFTISYLIINDTMGVKYGSSAKLIFYLISKKMVDASSMGFIVTPERKQLIDYAYFMWAEPQAMVVPRPEEASRFLLAFVRPFQSQVWLLVLASVFLVTGSMSLLSKVYSSVNIFDCQLHGKKSFFGYANRHILDILNHITNTGGTHCIGIQRRFPFLILLGFWLSAATVIVNCYSSTVISYLTLPTKKPPINSFEDLAASDDVHLIIRDDLVVGQQIMEAKTGALKILGDEIRRNPNRMVYQASEVINLLRTGQYAFPFMRSTGNLFIANQYELDRKCRFSITDPLSMYDYYSMALQKDSRFTAAFNEALIELWETGLPWFWVKINTPQAPQCFTQIRTHTNTATQIPIQLVDLRGAFLVLAVGIVLSTLAFILESMFTLKIKTNLLRLVKSGEQKTNVDPQMQSEFW